MPLSESTVQAWRPSWLPDNQRVVFDRAEAVVMKSVDGLGDETEFFKGKNRGLSRDGKVCHA